MRTRTIRYGGLTWEGSELRQWDSMEEVLIPKLVRELGPNRRQVHQARRRAEGLREDAYEKLAASVAQLAWEDNDPPSEAGEEPETPLS